MSLACRACVSGLTGQSALVLIILKCDREIALARRTIILIVLEQQLKRKTVAQLTAQVSILYFIFTTIAYKQLLIGSSTTKMNIITNRRGLWIEGEGMRG